MWRTVAVGMLAAAALVLCLCLSVAGHGSVNGTSNVTIGDESLVQQAVDSIEHD